MSVEKKQGIIIITDTQRRDMLGCYDGFTPQPLDYVTGIPVENKPKGETV